MEFKIVLALLIINTLIIVTTIVVNSIVYYMGKRKINDYYFYHEYVFGDGWEDPLLYGGRTGAFWCLFIIEAILIGIALIPIIITLFFKT